MLLSQLISALPADSRVLGQSRPELEVAGLCYDSRQAQPGFLFVAIPGQQADGHDFIPQAVLKGATVVVAEREVVIPPQVTLVITPDSRLALALLSAAFYSHPDQRLRLIGVTGTNGKTTTTNLIKYLLTQAGHGCGLVGTVGALAGDKPLPELLSASTTPESLELTRLLDSIAAAGCDYAVIEASSHALDQKRVAACDFAAAVFTNLTQDHLDYHGDMDAYCRSKTRLFAALDPAGDKRYAVINGDDPYAAAFTAASKAPVWTYGAKEGAGLRLLNFNTSLAGMRFDLTWRGQTYKLQMPLIGRFNLYNAMAAICVALAEGAAMSDIVGWLATAPQVAGRFELVDEGQDFAVVVDYAHTPDGLSNLLSAARALKPRRLITVFGCGGNRDVGKRPIMGRIAGRYSDVTIITSDNPRYEDALTIIEMIEGGIRDVCNNYLIEPEREKAVAMAVRMAGAGDMVVLAGKGHEDYQIVMGKKHHCDDRELARAAIRQRLG